MWSKYKNTRGNDKPARKKGKEGLQLHNLFDFAPRVTTAQEMILLLSILSQPTFTLTFK